MTTKIWLAEKWGDVDILTWIYRAIEDEEAEKELKLKEER